MKWMNFYGAFMNHTNHISLLIYFNDLYSLNRKLYKKEQVAFRNTYTTAIESQVENWLLKIQSLVKKKIKKI